MVKDRSKKKVQKKDVSIITICDPVPNFGNRLQNWAVQYVLLKNFDVNVKTLFYEKDIYNITCKECAKKVFHKLTKYYFTNNKKYWESVFMKAFQFKLFNNKYIRGEYISDLPEKESADYFILGSDQVWNPLWYSGMKKDLFFLTFADSKQKVCFSPSFGISKVPEEWETYFKDKLNTFENFSVREETGREIIQELTGKEAEVLIDPTLMIDASVWRKIAKKPKNGLNTHSPYILTYFLGRHPERSVVDIRRICDKTNMNVYHIMDIEQSKVYSSGPREFLYLIDHAEIVLTDSFHACVFSFLFGKPFLLYPRDDSEKNMLSRIDTLFNTFDLKRKYVGENMDQTIEEIFECDYSIGYGCLQGERKKVLDFLNNQIK